MKQTNGVRSFYLQEFDKVWSNKTPDNKKVNIYIVTNILMPCSRLPSTESIFKRFFRSLVDLREKSVIIQSERKQTRRCDALFMENSLKDTSVSQGRNTIQMTHTHIATLEINCKIRWTDKQFWRNYKCRDRNHIHDEVCAVHIDLFGTVSTITEVICPSGVSAFI